MTAGPLSTPAPAADPLGEPFNAASWLVDRHAGATPTRRAFTVLAAPDAAATTVPAVAGAVPGALFTGELTYGELSARVAGASAALSAAGVRAEERVLLCMADSAELAVLFLAALRAGAVPVPVSTMFTGRDLA